MVTSKDDQGKGYDQKQYWVGDAKQHVNHISKASGEARMQIVMPPLWDIRRGPEPTEGGVELTGTCKTQHM